MSERPAPLSDAAKRARTPLPPEVLACAKDDREHVETGRLVASMPLRIVRRPE